MYWLLPNLLCMNPVIMLSYDYMIISMLNAANLRYVNHIYKDEFLV